MKKIYFSVITSCFCCISIAQELPSPLCKIFCSARLQATGGVNLGTRSLTEYEEGNQGFVPGINLGLGLRTSLSEKLTFIPGISIDQKGSKYDHDYSSHYEPGFITPQIGQTKESNFLSENDYISSFNGRQDARSGVQKTDGHIERTLLTYFAIPLMLGYMPIENVPQFNVLLGLNTAFLLSRRTKSSIFGIERENKGKEGFRSVDFGVLLGAGYRFNNGFSANLVYDHGLTNILDSDHLAARNRTIKLMLIYAINFNPLDKDSYSSQRKNSTTN